MSTELSRPKTIQELVAERLRADILSGRVKPGQRLSQSQLAARLGVSRVPVRDALRMLEAEGLVALDSLKGAVVPELDVHEIVEVYTLREIIEGWAIERAAASATDELITSLRKLIDEMAEAAALDDVGHWVELDRAFHLAIYESLGMARLQQIVETLWNSTQYMRRSYCQIQGRIAYSDTLHRSIVEALERRDGAAARAMQEKHIRDVVRALRSSLKSGDG